MKKTDIITKLHLVEVLLVFGIIAIPASFVLRILYARQMIEWENNLMELIGIPAELCRATFGIGALCVLIAMAVRKRKKRKKSIVYQLPKTNGINEPTKSAPTTRRRIHSLHRR